MKEQKRDIGVIEVPADLTVDYNGHAVGGIYVGRLCDNAGDSRVLEIRRRGPGPWLVDKLVGRFLATRVSFNREQWAKISFKDPSKLPAKA